jgi:integral membrane protein
MINDSSTSLKRLYQVGFGEGISFVVLLGIAMPMKYFFRIPLAVEVVGMMHGVLFIAYVIALLNAKRANGLSAKVTAIAFLLSFLPFGTFFLEKYINKPN